MQNGIDYHKILIGNEFRFRQPNSSYMALIMVMDQVTQALKNDNIFKLYKGVWNRKSWYIGLSDNLLKQLSSIV